VTPVLTGRAISKKKSIEESREDVTGTNQRSAAMFGKDTGFIGKLTVLAKDGQNRRDPFHTANVA